MWLSYFPLPEGRQMRGPYPFNWATPHQRVSLQHLNPSLFTRTSTYAVVQILKMKVLGSVVFVLFYMVLVRKQGLQKGKKKKKTIEKQEEKLKHRTSLTPL